MKPTAPHRLLAIRNPGRGTVVANAVLVAESFFTRLRGLLGRPELERGQGLLLHPCRAVHTFGMRYAIDCVYLSAHWQVLAVAEALPPNRFGPVVPGAAMVLELPAGRAGATGTVPGDFLQPAPAWPYVVPRRPRQPLVG